MKPKLKQRLTLAGLGIFAVASHAIAADDAVEKSGQARFAQYCAVCHGADAKGNGPFANLMTTKPSDLTALAKNNGGEFPFGRVYDTIDGRNLLAAHGTTDMPIWGRDMKDAGLGGETDLRGRLVETIVYLRSIQQK